MQTVWMRFWKKAQSSFCLMPKTKIGFIRRWTSTWRWVCWQSWPMETADSRFWICWEVKIWSRYAVRYPTYGTPIMWMTAEQPVFWQLLYGWIRMWIIFRPRCRRWRKIIMRLLTRERWDPEHLIKNCKTGWMSRPAVY